MKKSSIVIILSIVFLVSCKMQSPTLAPFVSVYKRDWSGEVLPVYIILRQHPDEVFEFFTPAIGESIIGQWHADGDTLLFQPEYEYYCRDEKVIMREITDQDSLSIMALPRKLLKTKNCLIDATDYGQFFSGSSDSEPDVFDLVR